MDPNLMSCPTCGHSVSNIAAACTYCGGILVKKGQQPQTDDTGPGENAQVAKSPQPLSKVAESPPPLSQNEIPSTDKISDEAGETRLEATGQSDFSVLQPLANSPAAAVTSEPAAEMEAVSANESVSLEEEIESKPSDDQPESASKSESAKQIQDVEGDSEIAPTEAVLAESVPGDDPEPAAEVKQDLQEPDGETVPAADNVVSMARNGVQNETVTDEIQSSPEPEAANLSADEAGESEIWAKNIVKLIETEASQHESATPPTLDNHPPLKNKVEAAETMPAKELQPGNEADVKTDAQAGSLSNTSGGTIVLNLDDIVESPDGVLSYKTEETSISESQAKALKIETDAQELAAAIEKQKEALTKAQALKKQKEDLDKAQAQKKQKEDLAKAQALKKQKTTLAKAQALKNQKEARAKVQALKMQKLVLANAEALKRKKTVQAKTQALTQQKAAQATVETTKKGDSAAVGTPAAADRPEIDRGLQADTSMQTLIEKFKGQVIGINYDNSAEFREAQLVEANADYFSVFVKDKDMHYSYPINTILTVIEGKNGVDVGNKKQPNKFKAVIKVYPLVLF